MPFEKAQIGGERFIAHTDGFIAGVTESDVDFVLEAKAKARTRNTKEAQSVYWQEAAEIYNWIHHEYGENASLPAVQ